MTQIGRFLTIFPRGEIPKQESRFIPPLNSLVEKTFNTRNHTAISHKALMLAVTSPPFES